MIAQYKPNRGIQISSIILNWDYYRSDVRTILNEKFEEYDVDSDPDFPNLLSEIRRDIYRNILGEKCLIFFNYDENDLLNEIEIHYGIDLNILSEIFSFKENLNYILDSTNLKYKYIDDTEIHFSDIKMTIYNDLLIGGEGNHISAIILYRD